MEIGRREFIASAVAACAALGVPTVPQDSIYALRQIGRVANDSGDLVPVDVDWFQIATELDGHSETVMRVRILDGPWKTLCGSDDIRRMVAVEDGVFVFDLDCIADKYHA